MTKKLVIALVATCLLTLGACTKTSDESGAPVNQPGEAIDQSVMTPPAQPTQPNTETAPPAAPIDPYSTENQQQPGASPSPNSPNY